MTEQQALKWTEALRSGKYKQGKHYLRVDDNYCCLGVLCEISGLEGKFNGNTFHTNTYLYDGTSSMLPTVLQNEYNIGFSGRIFDVKGQPTSLVSLGELNDDGYTFDEIADLIEAVFVHKVLE